jgi:hypothetical protein
LHAVAAAASVGTVRQQRGMMMLTTFAGLTEE